MYQLIIHHDIGLSKDNKQFTKNKCNLGHVYLELKDKNNTIVYGIESGFEYRAHSKDRLELAKAYELQNPDEQILYSKVLAITEDQYKKAQIILAAYNQYLGKEIPSEICSLFGNHCAHFVNHIYRLMGLEGDYTRNYKTTELQLINTQLSNGYKMLGFYPGDKAFTVFGSSIQEVAKRYNLNISQVTKRLLTQEVIDMEIAILQEACNQISFEISPNPQLLDHLKMSEDDDAFMQELIGIKNSKQELARLKQFLLPWRAYLKQKQKKVDSDD